MFETFKNACTNSTSLYLFWLWKVGLIFLSWAQKNQLKLVMFLREDLLLMCAPLNFKWSMWYYKLPKPQILEEIMTIEHNVSLKLQWGPLATTKDTNTVIFIMMGLGQQLGFLLWNAFWRVKITKWNLFDVSFKQKISNRFPIDSNSGFLVKYQMFIFKRIWLWTKFTLLD